MGITQYIYFTWRERC